MFVARHLEFRRRPTFQIPYYFVTIQLTEGLAESVVGAEGAPRAFILKLGYFGLIL